MGVINSIHSVGIRVSYHLWASIIVSVGIKILKYHPFSSVHITNISVGIKIHYRLSTNSYIINILSYTVLR